MNLFSFLWEFKEKLMWFEIQRYADELLMMNSEQTIKAA